MHIVKNKKADGFKRQLLKHAYSLQHYICGFWPGALLTFIFFAGTAGLAAAAALALALFFVSALSWL